MLFRIIVLMIYKKLIRPLLFQQDAESAHELALKLASKTNRSPFLSELAKAFYGLETPKLEQKIFGLTFPNPIGLAAGFDKNGTTPKAMQALGFGFVEIGSVTARSSEGNPKPRAFRLPEDESLINRMGLNNDGVDAVCNRLHGLHLEVPLGINIAKTNDASIHGDEAIRDYLYSYEKVQDLADYVTVNISCPNTGEGKTFEDPQALEDLLAALRPGAEGRAPTLVKFTVDIEKEPLEKLIRICEEHHVSGYVATNTSSNRAGLETSEHELQLIGNGGLSGRAIQQRSTQVVQWISEITEGKRPIIGVGGIHDVESALEKLEAGASLLQLYSGMIYEGPGLVRLIKKGLIQRGVNFSTGK